MSRVDVLDYYYLRAHGVDPYSLVYKPGDEPGMDHVSYLVRDDAALDAAAAQLETPASRVRTGNQTTR